MKYAVFTTANRPELLDEGIMPLMPPDGLLSYLKWFIGFLEGQDYKEVVRIEADANARNVASLRAWVKV